MNNENWSLKDKRCGIIGHYYHEYDIVYLCGLLIEDYKDGLLNKEQIEKRFGEK